MVATTDPSGAELVLVRDRDARAAIRGFVYQIDLTIQRWLNLGPDDLLLPERGEDIDVIARWMTGGDDQLLEQVKHLTTSVTLNTPAVRAALAGFRETAVANPGRSLRFRFATNAGVTKERPAPFPGRVEGIIAWEAARQEPDPPSAAFVSAVRETFQDAPRPGDLAEATWTQFLAFIATAEPVKLEAFVRSVEFSTGLEEQTATKDTSISLLVSEGHVPSRVEAEDAYLALFHHVTQLLCGPAPRRLLRSDIAAAIAGATHSARILAALHLVTRELAEHATRIARLESAVLLTDTTATDISAKPPPPAYVTQRATLVASITAQLRAAHLVAVIGQPGTGKTQALRLVADSFSGSVAWVRLRGYNAAEAAGYWASVSAVFAQARPPDLVVLDDMLLLHQAERLREGIQALLRDTRWSHTRFLSSSVGTHGGAAVASFGTGITLFTIPPLTTDEVVELARQMGGALDPTDAAFLIEMTQGHPQMVVAVGLYLARTGWRLTGDVIRGLLERRFTDGLTGETAQRFIDTVTDGDTRELVHRLRLCITRVRSAQVHAVSGVAPTVADPMTRMSSLDGVWLQRERENEWAMAPLIECLPADPLPLDRRIACHRELARSYVSARRVINVSNVRFVLHHMREGLLFDDFARLYRDVASAALVREATPVTRFVLQVLNAEALPPSLVGSERLTLVALKEAAGVTLGAEVTEATLTELATSRDLTDEAKQIIAVTLGLRLKDVAAVTLVGNGVRALANETRPELRNSRATLLLGLFGQLHSPEAFNRWLDLLGVLGEDERSAIEKEALWMPSLIGTFVLVTERAPGQVRLGLARRARGVAEALRMRGLLAFSLRAEALALAETDRTAAIALLRENHPTFETSSREQALISASLVQVHAQRGDVSQVLEFAKNLVASDSNGIEYQAAQGALRGTIAAASTPTDAVSLAERSVELAQSSELVPDDLLIRALGELGVARWLAGDLRGAMSAIVTCGDKLLQLGSDHRDWRQLIPITVHTANYLAALARGLASSLDPPQLGAFYNSDERYEQYFSDEKPLVLASLIVALAGQVNESDALARAAAVVEERIATASGTARLAVVINAGAYLASRGLLREIVISAWGAIDAPRPNELPNLPANWDERDQSVLLFAISQATLSVCLGFLEDDLTGRARLADLTAALRELDAQGSRAEWGRFAELLVAAVSRDVEIREVMDRRSRLGNGVLECSVMLLAALHPRASLSYAVRNHVAAVEALWEIFRKITDAIVLLVEPYLRRYWQRALDEQAFRFRRPAAIRSEFAAAAESADPGERVYFTLRAVLDGLGVDERLDRSTFILPART